MDELNIIESLVIGIIVGTFFGAISEFSFLFTLMFGSIITIVIEVERKHREINRGIF